MTTEPIAPQAYVCGDCGARLVFRQIVAKEGLYFWLREFCPCEREWREQRRKDELEQARRLNRQRSRIVGDLAEKSLDGIKPVRGIEPALSTAREYLETWPHEGGQMPRMGLIFSGTFGCGKTHLACGIANPLVDRLIPVQFWQETELFNRVKEGFDSPDRRIDLAAYFAAPSLLILDELALSDEKPGGPYGMDTWRREVLYTIVESRNRAGKPMIVTTNRTEGELLENIGGRIYDRLRHSCEWVDVAAGSFRARTARARWPKVEGVGE